MDTWLSRAIEQEAPSSKSMIHDNRKYAKRTFYYISGGSMSRENVIYEAIREMQGSFDEKKKNAQAISEKIRKEGGVAEAVRLIDMNIKQSIDATRKGFEDSFSSGVFYNK
ncbi:MAG: hypothetical protein SOY39_01040 [Lachnospiraceae bacterium]|nr:hypothetical protein [Lachnospiraceae bacterium]